jgi:hypothetical protein
MGESSEIPKLRATDVAQRLLAIRRENLVDVSQPLVLIARPNRSGGTLPEPAIRWAPRASRPSGRAAMAGLALARHLGSAGGVGRGAARASPRAWLQRGYHKDRPARKLGYDDQLENFPLMLDPLFLRELFVDLAREQEIESRRDIVRLYFTALHNAWLDNQNLYAGRSGGSSRSRASCDSRSTSQGSSATTPTAGISRGVLSDEDATTIDAHTRDVYERACALAP